MEFRIFGPPGTGKTTYLTRQLQRAVEAHGSNQVLVASFTKAAAQEIASRESGVDQAMIGTLHSHCYRELKQPTLAETKIREWNDEHPRMALSCKGNAMEDNGADGGAGESTSDEAYAASTRFRNLLWDERSWPSSAARHFNTKWREWKERKGYMDFTDLIEECVDRRFGAPSATVGVFDEAQDLTPLQLALVKKWGGYFERTLVAGDDDQCIYSFNGASVDAFLSGHIPDSHKRFLDQSYRVPRQVQAFAQKMIEKVSRREQKTYKPRDEEGELRRIMVGLKQPYKLIDEALPYINAGESVMFLAACSYHLTTLVAALKEHAIPFHNPFKRTRGDWNPLHAGQGVTAGERLLHYMGPHGLEIPDGVLWDQYQLASWIKLCAAKGLLQRGGKKRIEEAAKDDPYGDDQMAKLYMTSFHEEALKDALKLDPLWLSSVADAKAKKALAYPTRILDRLGPKALRDTPRVIVGTIHSVKGGEADNVFLAPDVSPQATAKMAEKEGRDEVIRQFYVGATRARKRLILCAPRTKNSVHRELFR